MTFVTSDLIYVGEQVPKCVLPYVAGPRSGVSGLPSDAIPGTHHSPLPQLSSVCLGEGAFVHSPPFLWQAPLPLSESYVDVFSCFSSLSLIIAQIMTVLMNWHYVSQM